MASLLNPRKTVLTGEGNIPALRDPELTQCPNQAVILHKRKTVDQISSQGWMRNSYCFKKSKLNEVEDMAQCLRK